MLAKTGASEHIVDTMLIDGRAVVGEGADISVIAPGDEGLVATFAGASAAQIDQAIAAAKAAFDDGRWSGLAATERVDLLRGFLDEVEARAGMIIDLVAREAGCPIGSPAMYGQVTGPINQCRQALDGYLLLPEMIENPLSLADRVDPMGFAVQSIKRYVPIGVVGAIAAYNFPIFTALWKIIPGLVTGNTMVLRPSPLTPLATLLLGEAALAAGLPSGVLNIVADASHEGGVRLSTHPDIGMIAFTGSSAVGASVMAQAAPTMKRLQLELGGKSAQIIMPDRLEAARDAAARVCLVHAGQGCVLGTRIFVPETEKARVIDEMIDAIGGVRPGDPMDRATVMGPVISAGQRERCERFVALAVEGGGRVAYGGERPAGLDRGFYFEPTILDVPDNDNPAAREEIFGPIVAVIGYRDLDHAVAMANDNAFGLSGYVWGKDVAKAVAIASRLQTGAVHVNRTVFSAHVSSGGHKMSGIGRERGVEGFRIYQEIQMMSIAQ